MKKISVAAAVFAVLSLSSLAPVAAQQKYALVIGNGAYKNLARLNNPVNDANDMAASLRELGFTVDAVVDSGRVQMEDAIERFKNRLSVSKNSYGFLFYAGHGVQSGGVNYLIPVDADIRSEAYLRDRAVSVQAMLDEINQAGNELNIVVLDACRDNPFSWGRSGSRGLQVVGNQPADSIIVYATAAGATASDGAGRNGLFTSQLLKNLKTPGIDVNEVFRLTGGDVARVSGGVQRPAVYNQFYGIAYLGSRPSAQTAQPAPPPPASTPAHSAKSYVESGLAYHNKGDYDRAIADYTQAIRIDPKYALAYHNRGVAYEVKKDFDRAMSDYNQVILLDPNYAKAYHGRGVAYRTKGDYDRAIADFTQAIRIDPNFVSAYINRGLAYRNKGDYDRAIADYTQAIRIDPKYVSAYHNRGVAYEAKKDFDRAMSDYNQVILLDPKHVQAYHGRGLASYYKGDYDRAIADFAQAIRIDPNFVSAYINRGNAYRNKGDYDRAIADFTQALRIDPDYVSAYNNRGDAYYKKGDYDRAIADFTRALRLDPNYTFAQKNLEIARRARGW
ncbi:MAG: tetratricopeptide repeat protein [Treponema sp.]|jgi:tetratricopeptide (TPR) repeat protein|nr:tetratricopeptide repeat protein [Treponema sp.]